MQYYHSTNNQYTSKTARGERQDTDIKYFQKMYSVLNFYMGQTLFQFSEL